MARIQNKTTGRRYVRERIHAAELKQGIQDSLERRGEPPMPRFGDFPVGRRAVERRESP